MNSFTASINRWADAWAGPMWQAAWQAAVVGLCVLAVAWAAKRWSSPLKYGLLLVALVKFATPPMLWLPTGLLNPLDERVRASLAEARSNGGPSERGLRAAAIAEPVLRDGPDVFIDNDPNLNSATSAAAPGDLKAVPMPRIAEWASAEVDGERAGEGDDAQAMPAQVVNEAQTPMDSSSRGPRRLVTYVFLLWAAGAMVAAVWICAQSVRIRRLARASRDVLDEGVLGRYRELARRIGMRSVPRLCESAEIGVPLCCGILWPAIILPRDLCRRLTPLQLDEVLAHELAHHQRRDLWISGVQGLLFIVWWFHPVFWLVGRAIRRVREECCDDLVLASGCASRETYCETLLAVARLQAGGYAPHFAMAMSASGRRLASRLARVMDATMVRRSAISAFGLLFVAAAAAMLLPGVRGHQPDSPTDQRRETATPEDAQPPSEEVVDENDPNVQIISGTVADEEGNPISGAEILITVSDTFDTKPDEYVLVIAQGNTDEQGSFRVEVDRKRLENPFDHGFAVWVYGRGYAAYAISINRVQPYRPLTVVLKPEAASFTILGSDGQPLKDAAVYPRSLHWGTTYEEVPSELYETLRRKTDGSGGVTLPIAMGEDVTSLAIEAPGIAPQRVAFLGRGSEVPQVQTLALKPVGDIAIELRADDQQAVANVDVLVSTIPVGSASTLRQPYKQGTTLVVRTDEQGRVNVPAIAAGKLRLVVDENEALDYLATPPEDVLVAPGRTTEVTVPLQKAVRITGRVLERGTDKPIGGVLVAVNRSGTQHYNRTNEQGEYRLLQFPGAAWIDFYPLASHVLPPQLQPAEVPRADAHRLPDFLLKRGYTLKGKALNNDGKPVERVMVRAFWRSEFDEETTWVTHSPDVQSWGYSDENGNFSIDRVPTDVAVQLAAAIDYVDVAAPISIRGQRAEPLVIRVREPDLVTLTGAVVDGQGQPVPNIEFRILKQSIASPNGMWLGPTDEGTVDTAGKIQSTKKLPRGGKYQLQIVLEDAVVAESNWLEPAKANTTAFDPIVYRGPPVASNEVAQLEVKPPLNRVLLAGVAVDSAGEPVAGADVIVWSMADRVRTKSAADGSFSIPGIPEEGAFLFVDAEGYRFHGQWAEPAADPIRAVLKRTTEPAEPMAALDEPPVGAELHAKAWELFEPIAVEVLVRTQREGQPTSYNVSEYLERDVLQLLSRYNAEWALQYVNEHKAGDEWVTNTVKTQVAEHLAATDMQRALDVVEGINSPERRVIALVELANKLPGAQDQARKRLLERAEQAAASTDAGPLRAQSLAVLAGAYRQGGQSAKARELLDMAQGQFPDAVGEGYAKYIFSLVAYERAVLDGIDSTALLEPIADEFERNRYLGNVAHALAATNPAAAEAILQRTPGRQERIVRVCHAMAAVDLPRARRIAESIADPVERAYAIGLIAAGITEKDRDQAAELVAEAYGLLAETVEAGTRTSNSIYGPVDTAAAMLPFVEAIDPTLVREYFWRTLSLRKNATFGSTSMALGPYGDGDSMRLSDPVLAACLARYDLDVARRVLRPPGDESLDAGVTDYPYYYFFTSAILDPEGTLAFVASLPSDSRGQMIAQHQAWRELFASFAHRGLDRWDYLVDRQMHRWVPGKEDL
jgi:beta-lactamase regulating signal transducer with metallopeptidase domain/protocatechuate 3,4-dioxygenase beta subunit